MNFDSNGNNQERLMEHLSVERWLMIKVLERNSILSASFLMTLGCSLILRVGFDSPVWTAVCRILTGWWVIRAFNRFLGRWFSVKVKLIISLIGAVSYIVFEVLALPSLIALVPATSSQLVEFRVALTVLGIILSFFSIVTILADHLGLMFLGDPRHVQAGVASVRTSVDEFVTSSRVRRTYNQNQVAARSGQTHIRQDFAVYIVQLLLHTIKWFELSERDAADLRDGSDRWALEIKENAVFLSPTGLRQTQKFITIIIKLNYHYRRNDGAAALGEGFQTEVISWVQRIAQHPKNKLYLKHAEDIFRKFTTVATLNTLDRVFPPLPKGLEPIDLSTYIYCLLLYISYIFCKDISEIRITLKYLLPIFVTYRFCVNKSLVREILHEGHPLRDPCDALNPKTWRFLIIVLGFLLAFPFAHSNRIEHWLPRTARNSVLFNLSRYGVIPFYLSFRRYINLNREELGVNGNYGQLI